jgi:hypothetical protein
VPQAGQFITRRLSLGFYKAQLFEQSLKARERTQVIQGWVAKKVLENFAPGQSFFELVEHSVVFPQAEADLGGVGA